MARAVQDPEDSTEEQEEQGNHRAVSVEGWGLASNSSALASCDRARDFRSLRRSIVRRRKQAACSPTKP